MPEPKHIYGTVHKGGTSTQVDRIVNEDGNNITQAAFAGGTSSSSGDSGPPISYTIFLLNDQDEDDRTPVSGHENVALVASEVVFDVLQLDNLWQNDDGNNIDDDGYNFRHTPDITPDPAFAEAGRNYLVEYTLRPIAGQAIKVTHRLRCI
jgi:hypothetical protein